MHTPREINDDIAILAANSEVISRPSSDYVEDLRVGEVRAELNMALAEGNMLIENQDNNEVQSGQASVD